MKGRLGVFGGREPEAQTVTDHDPTVREVSNSPLFLKSPVLRELLLYLWTHRDVELSEYAIGVDVLGRRAEFNPKSDATVRVQISRLRARLREFYEGEGKGSLHRVVIPIGAHRVSIIELPGASPEPPPRPVRRPFDLSRIFLAASAILALLFAADDLRLRFSQSVVKPVSVPIFWQPLVDPHEPINLIVPAPVFMRWQGLPFVARDFRINNAESAPDSPILKMLIDKFGKPELSQLYTVASDTIATSHLVKFLQDHGARAEIVDTTALSLDHLESTTAVVLAGSGTVTQLDDTLRATNFRFAAEPGKNTVTNAHPLPGEPTGWTTVLHAPLRATAYGVVAQVPGRAGKRTLLLASDHNENLAEVLTTTSELRQIETLWAAHGSPKYFEFVVRMEINGDKTLQSSPVVFRGIASK